MALIENEIWNVSTFVSCLLPEVKDYCLQGVNFNGRTVLVYQLQYFMVKKYKLRTRNGKVTVQVI